jgi:polyphenol oxidase
MTTPLTLWENLQHDGVMAGFTQAGADHSFNLALHAGGDLELAIKNRRSLCTTLNLPFDSYTCAEQVHGTSVAIVRNEQKGRGRLSFDDSLPASDALITNESGIMLNIFVADCVPIILYDPKTRSGGLCHGGWRGTAKLIIMKTLELMTKTYGSRPADMQAYIGPSIGDCCYNVGENVEEAFGNSFNYKEDPFNRKESQLFLDLKKAQRLQLKEAGLKENSITSSPLCTCCSTEPFFSYRKSGDATGRFSAFFYIQNSK